MANLLYHQPSSPSYSRLAAGFRGRNCCLNSDIDLFPSIVRHDSFECHASRGQFRFRAEEELFRDGGFSRFEFGNRKKKRPWWLDDDDDDDDYDDWMNDEDDWSMLFKVFRTLSCLFVCYSKLKHELILVLIQAVSLSGKLKHELILVLIQAVSLSATTSLNLSC